jgi:cellulose synthase/poly-beta-1,6-N-acetylglucosamine synthase-like glycosyltransferase
MNPDECVSAIIPARNEERTIGEAVISVAEQPEIREVVVVNDQSSDGTGEILRRLAAGQPKLRVCEAGPLPAGWVGKNHAASLGAQKAACDWLLFTDADALHLPGSTARALAEAESRGADLVSYSPGQEMHTWWERALIPFVFCRLSQLYSYAAVNDPDSPAAAANGQYLLIRRNVYEQIGGHAAVRDEVLEDVALARLAKSAGFRLHFAPGDQICRVRMYSSFQAMWEGWSKNLLPLVSWSGQRVTRELLSVMPWIPLLCLLLAPWHIIFGALGLLLLAGRHASYAALLRKNRFPLASVLYYLVGAALYCAALLASDWGYARGKIAWKGREYPVATPARRS